MLKNDMQLARISPDVIAGSIAITACERGNRWEAAVALLWAMCGCDVMLDVVACNTTISACTVYLAEFVSVRANSVSSHISSTSISFHRRMES